MRLTKKFICEFIYNSNRIEGINHSLEKIIEIYSLYKSKKKLNPRESLDLATCPQITSSLDAIEWLKKNYTQKPSLDSIRHLHGIVMNKVLPILHAGTYRTMPVKVGSYLAPSSCKVLYLLKDFTDSWGKNLKIKSYKYSPKEIKEFLYKGGDSITLKDYTPAYIRHMEFEYIHPFLDGNGRVGRLLYLWDDLYTNDKHKMIKISDRPSYYYSLYVYKAMLRNTQK